MVNQRGLLCVVKAIVGLVLVAVALPHSSSAQTDLSARVPIISDDEGFGDLLLVQDAESDTVYIFGLTGAVPPQSDVTITAGEQTINALSSIVGQFPIRSNNPLAVNDASEIGIATISALKRDGSTITGEFDLNVTSDTVLSNLESYAVGPNKLLRIVTDDPNHQGRVGYALLTQVLIEFEGGGNGEFQTILDSIEGVGNTPDGASVQTQSVPLNSMIEVYRGLVDRDGPNPRDLIQILRTDTFTRSGQIASTGAFFPFTVPSVTGERDDLEPKDYIYSLRIMAPGVDPFWATITNDVEVEFQVEEVLLSANDENRSIIIANTDPYAIVTVYAENSRDSQVLWPTDVDVRRAEPSGRIEIAVPPAFDDDGFPMLQQRVYVAILDPFGNENRELFEVIIKEDTPDPVITSTSIDGPNYLIHGRAEARATLQVFVNNDPSETPTEEPQLVDDLPGSAFLYTQTRVRSDGTFTLRIPQGAANFIYIRTLDFYGHISRFARIDLSAIGEPEAVGFVHFVQPFLEIINRGKYQEDGVRGELVQGDGVTPVTSTVELLFDSAGNELPIPIRKSIRVSAFLSPIADPDAPFPFVNELVRQRVIPSDQATYEINIPEFDRIGNEYITDFYLVALGSPFLEDGTVDESIVEVLGWVRVTPESEDRNGNLFKRIGPEIIMAPLPDHIELREGGKGVDDLLDIPTINHFLLPSDALPRIYVLTGGNPEDGTIDVTDPAVRVIASQWLRGVEGLQFGFGLLPEPGLIAPINLGRNYWDAETQSVVGLSVVWVSLADIYGNLSPNPVPVYLDVFTPDPDLSAISATGAIVQGATEAVEEFAHVILYENPDRTGRIASTQANQVGAFYISGLTLRQSTIYIVSRDQAGNESNVIPIRVTDPIIDPHFVVLDGFGTMHSNMASVYPGSPYTDLARRFAGVRDPANPSLLKSDSPLYVLYDVGIIGKTGASGKLPLEEEAINVHGGFARDIAVIDHSPFKGYVLLGNGIVIPFGDVPFFGDIASEYDEYTPFYHFVDGELRVVYPATSPFSTDMTPIDPAIITDATPRLRHPDGSGRLFDDLNRNGEYDNEDLNDNGMLDVIIGLDGTIIYDEDANGNGVLDREPIIDPSEIHQGFHADIARALQVVQSPSGEVLGYVIMDGNGVMWTFGSGYGEDAINHGLPTAGYSEEDTFRDFELIFEIDGDDIQVIDYVKLNGFGQLFGVPGGPLGAGDPDDENNRGLLSFRLNAKVYDFDIARSIRISPFDTNGDGKLDWRDGFYVLNGFGGITAVGGAQPLGDDIFFGMDIARDLEFTAQGIR